MTRIFKFVGILSLILIFLAQAFIIRLFHRSPWKFRQRCRDLNTIYCRIALRLLSIHVNWKGEPVDVNEDNFFIVSNHLSYLDVLVLNSRIPACFVTSQEVRETPVLGSIAFLAGCIFVERRNKMKISQEISEITRGLNLGLNVLIFPEATSTNGEAVLPFKKPLFRSAVVSNTPVLPLTVNYRFINGKPMSLDNRDLVCWYGDMDFLPHLWKVCGQNSIHCEVTFNKPLTFEPQVNLAVLSEFSWLRVTGSYAPISGARPLAEISFPV